MGYTFRNSDLLLGRYSGSFFKEQIISPNSGSIILFDKNLNPNVVTTSSLFFSKLSASRLYVDKSASINNLRVTGPTTLIGQLTASSTRINGNVNVIGSVKATSFTGSFSGSINSSNVNGTTNYIPKFTSANSVGNSVIYQSGNNIGIGTTSPTQKLTIISGSVEIASNDRAGELYFGNDGTSIYLKRDNSYDLSLVQNGDSNSKLYLASAGNVYVSIDSNNNDTDKAFIVQNNAIKAGTELFRIQESGNVGIGTTSPNNKLDIWGGSGTTLNIANSDDIGRGGKLTILSSSATGRQFYVGTTSAIYNLVFGIDSIEQMRLDTNGNLGIGTTSPSAKLHVSGSASSAVYFQGSTKINVTANNNVGTSDQPGNLQVQSINLHPNSTTETMYIRRLGTAQYQFQTYNFLNTGEIHLQPYGGNVGIGTITPSGKLDVNGNVIATSFTGSFSGSNARFGKLTGSGVRITGPTVVVGNTTIGDASSDTLTVNATSTFNAPATFTQLTGSISGSRARFGQLTGSNLRVFNNAKFGSSVNDQFIVSAATATFSGIINSTGYLTSSGGARIQGNINFANTVDFTGNNTVILGSIIDNPNKVFINNAKTKFNNNFTASSIRVTGPSLFVDNTIIGDANTDTLTVNATSTFNAPTTFTQLTGSISGSRARFGQLTGSELRVNGDIRFGGEITVQPTRATSSDGFNLNIFGGDVFTSTRPGGNLILRGGYGTDGSGSVILKDSVQIGDTTANQDSLTVYSTTNFIGKISGSNIRITGNTVIGDASSDTLKVNATTTFFGPLTSSNLRTNGRLHVSSSASGAAFIVSTANQGGTNDTNAAFIVTGSRVGIMTDDVDYTLEVNGSFAATTKSFVINYKNKPGSKLVHASLEGPEHGVYCRGNTTSSRVNLPEYWNWLVKDDNINIILTSNKRYQELYVENIVLNTTSSYFTVKERGIKGWFNRIIKKPLNYSYLVNAERKDVPPLEVELKKRKHRK